MQESYRMISVFIPLNGTGGAGIFTFSAPDTFRCIDVLQDIDVHGTNCFTFMTENTAVFIQIQVYYADFIKKSIKCSQWTEIPAKWPVYENRCQNQDTCNHQFPYKQISRHLTQRTIGNQKWNSGFDGAGRAEIFAEKGFAQSEFIDENHGEQNDKKQQNQIFQITEFMVKPIRNMKFGSRDFIEKILQKTEQAQESADDSAKNGTDDH